MKKIVYISFLLILAMPMSAQEHAFYLGLRGGVEKPFVKAESAIQSYIQPAGNLDIRYGFYAPTEKPTQFGMQVGLGFGFAQSEFKGSFAEQYTNIDYLGLEMPYNTSANFHSTMTRMYMEIPLLATMRSHGFVLGIGAKAQFPLWSKSSQSLSDVFVDAFYKKYTVHVPNELITGIVTDSEVSGPNLWKNAGINVLLSLQTGYEWQVKPQHHIGLMVYADYNVWNSYRSSDAPVINVSSISNVVYPVPDVVVKDAPSVLAKAVHPLQVGISLYYAFSSGNKEVKEVEPQLVYRTDTITQVDTMRIHDVDTLRLYDTMRDTIYIHDTIVVNGTSIVIDTAVVQDRILSQKDKDLLKIITRANVAEYYFPSGVSNVTKNTFLMGCIREMATLMREDSNLHIRIIGHTDSTGDHTSNVVVGQRRADAVKIELLRLGVQTEQVETTSKAETQPIAPNDTSTNRDRNRRVEIQLL